MPLRYAELRPDELDAAWSKKPLAIIAWGALEWHGPHLPLGLDGLVAESFAERLAEQSGGVLLPACWMPITTLPHPASLDIRTDALRMILDDTLEGLYTAGARMVCIVSGHYAQGHEIELYEAALRAMDSHNGYNVLAATPLEVLGDDSLLDHAARWETAQLQALRPDLVNVEVLPEQTHPRRHAVLGEHPAKASPSEGQAKTDEALKVWTQWIDQMAKPGGSGMLRDFYLERKRAYSKYVRTYYMTSWDQALRDWWLTLD